MECIVDGRQIPAELVYFRETGFGKPALGYSLKSCRIKLGINEVESLFGPYYADYVCDDLTYGKDADDTDKKLRALEWPKLKALIEEYPELFGEFIMHGNSYGFMQEIFRQQKPATRRYLVNTLNAVHVQPNHISLDCDVIDLGDEIMHEGQGEARSR